MGFDIGEALTGGVTGAIGAGMGLLLEGHNDKRQIKQQTKLQNLQIAGQKEMTDYNMNKQLQMWKDTSYGPQIEQMKNANVNPALMYGMGGGGGQSMGAANGNVSSGSAQQNAGEVQQGMGLSMQAAQLALLNSQKKNIDADTLNKLTGANKTGGVDTEKTKADTLNVQQQTTNAKIQEQLLTLENRQKSENLYDNINAVKASSMQIAEQLEQLYRTGKIQENTYDATVKQKQAEAIGASLKNDLTQEQITQIKNGIAQGWKDLDIKNFVAQAAAGNKDQDQIIQVINTILHYLPLPSTFKSKK